MIAAKNAIINRTAVAGVVRGGMASSPEMAGLGPSAFSAPKSLTLTKLWRPAQHYSRTTEVMSQ